MARNLFLRPSRSIRRKLREYALAYALLLDLGKLRQVELYVNIAEWGDGIWGLGAASLHYFGRTQGELTAAEAIILATILPAPRRGIAFVLAPGIAARQDAVATKLWRTRLLTDLGLAETVDRLREVRSQLRASGDARTAWRAVEHVMGPDGLQSERLPGAARPLTLTCDVSRRGL